MTCIAGAIKDGDVCIGGDAVSTSYNSDARIGVHGKVFRVGEFLIGSSGTVRTQQIMRYLVEPLLIKGDLMDYMVKFFIPMLRIAMKDNGGEITTSSGVTEMDARFLVGLRGRLFTIDGGYGVFESRAPYAAVGCADQEALAGMFTAARLLDVNVSPRVIVEHGLYAAAEFDTSIRPPFTIMTLTQTDWHGAEAVVNKSNGEYESVL